MDLTDCRALLGHCEWADAEVWAAVRSGSEDAALREKLHHLHLVQWTYLQIWQGVGVQPAELGAFPTAASLQDWVRQFYRELTSYLGGIGGGVTSEIVRFPWADRVAQRFGRSSPATWADSVQQVAMHSSYHRGQVASRLRELGLDPPLTDFIAWIWKGRPLARWGGDDAA